MKFMFCSTRFPRSSIALDLHAGRDLARLSSSAAQPVERLEVHLQPDVRVGRDVGQEVRALAVHTDRDLPDRRRRR